jgi:D-alanyl-lipoteichoic acid acyltransferase DltB (MBOAT superfamily)
MEPSRSLLSYLTFVAFFPQLVAGPIVRAALLLPQLEKRRHFNLDQAATGCRLILGGLFKKVVIADNASVFANTVYSVPSSYTAPALLLATCFFSMQIYCDFSGYTDIAIGIAKILGIEIPPNFRTPYFAHNLQDFWRRWHISLSSFFRDYVYIPLGGSNKNSFLAFRNLLVVFLISGLWHGANITFVLWGAFHFCGLLIFRMYQKHVTVLRSKNILIHSILAVLVTQLFVTFGWVFFRAKTLSDAYTVFSRMLNPLCYNISQLNLLKGEIPIITLIVGFLTIEFIQRNHFCMMDLGRFSQSVRVFLYSATLLSIFLFGKASQSTFIYFQF